MLNLEYLMSGRQLAAENDHWKQTQRKGTTSKNKRMRDFYNSSLDACTSTPKSIVNLEAINQALQKPARKDTPALPRRGLCKNSRLDNFYNETLNVKQNTKNIINLDFIRSGKQLSPASVRKEPETETRARSRSMRLEEFHQKTLQASQESVKTVNNLDFMRSGKHLSPATHRKQPDESRSRSRSMRLEDFHLRTLEAAKRVPMTTG
eukprot:m.33729 g.33729  ORF g.33729 m.33729 type:complete len:207 (+) comp8592_c0_seq1:325-945(+)